MMEGWGRVCVSVCVCVCVLVCVCVCGCDYCLAQDDAIELLRSVLLREARLFLLFFFLITNFLTFRLSLLSSMCCGPPPPLSLTQVSHTSMQSCSDAAHMVEMSL